MAHLASPHLRLVVTDVVMPGMDGWELGRRLAVDCPTVPVLYMSAYPRPDIFHRGAPSPSVPFLQKPFAPEVFVKTVRGLLEAGLYTNIVLPPACRPDACLLRTSYSAAHTHEDIDLLLAVLEEANDRFGLAAGPGHSPD